VTVEHDVQDLSLADAGGAKSSGPSRKCPSCASSASGSTAKNRWPASASPPASTSPPRPPTSCAPSRPAGPTRACAPATPSPPRTTRPPPSWPSMACPSLPSRARDHATYYRHIHQALDHRPQVTMDDGADTGRRHPQRAHRPPARHHRRHRRDHHRRHPPAGHGPRRRPRLPDHRRQRRHHQALFRQPLRHRPVHHRRHHPRHQRPAGRQKRRRRRLRLVQPRHRHARQGHGRQRHRHRSRPLRALEAVMDGYRVMPCYRPPR